MLVAHNGKTLQLDVQPGTRVDAVQHALVAFTGLPVQEQIVMHNGARLDPAKTLAAYRLPVVRALTCTRVLLVDCHGVPHRPEGRVRGGVGVGDGGDVC